MAHYFSSGTYNVVSFGTHHYTSTGWAESLFTQKTLPTHGTTTKQLDPHMKERKKWTHMEERKTNNYFGLKKSEANT